MPRETRERSQVIYTRISPVNQEWLNEQMASSKVPMAQIIDTLITNARENGHTVQPMHIGPEKRPDTNG